MAEEIKNWHPTKGENWLQEEFENATSGCWYNPLYASILEKVQRDGASDAAGAMATSLDTISVIAALCMPLVIEGVEYGSDECGDNDFMKKWCDEKLVWGCACIALGLVVIVVNTMNVNQINFCPKDRLAYLLVRKFFIFSTFPIWALIFGVLFPMSTVISRQSEQAQLFYHYQDKDSRTWEHFLELQWGTGTLMFFVTIILIVFTMLYNGYDDRKCINAYKINSPAAENKDVAADQQDLEVQ